MPKVGDRVWVDDGMKVRAGVVMRNLGRDLFLVLTGTGTPREPPRVEFHHLGRDGKAFGLDKPTYFFARPLLFAREVAIKGCVGPCSKRKFFELERMLDAQLGVAVQQDASTTPVSSGQPTKPAASASSLQNSEVALVAAADPSTDS